MQLTWSTKEERSARGLLDVLGTSSKDNGIEF